jgi:hypothetical protein
VTVTGGLEDVAVREIRSKLKGVSDVKVEKRQRIGRIHFRYDRSPKRLLELRCVEGVFAMLSTFGGVTSGRPGLLRVADAIASVDLAPGVVLYNILNGIPETSGIAMNCTVGRGHRFSASELHQVLRVVLAETYDLDEEEQRGPYYLQVRIEKSDGLVGFRLSTKTDVRSRVPGDMSLSSAHGIASLVRPERGERWIDLLGHGGTVLHAFRESYGVSPVAFETHPAWAAEANDLLRGSQANTAGLWDGVGIPVKSRAVNGVFLRLRRRDTRFDASLQAECVRILAEHGRVVLLGERDRDLEEDMATGQSLLRCSARHPIHLGGEALALYDLRLAAT